MSTHKPGPPRPMHNRYKLRFFVICVVVGIALVIAGVMTGHLGWAVPGALAALGSVPSIWVIVRGHGNPWWMQSPLDPSEAKDADASPQRYDRKSRGQTSAGSRPRALYLFIVASSGVFVVLGLVVLVAGVVDGRLAGVIVGAGCVIFFGFGVWVGVNALRGSV